MENGLQTWSSDCCRKCSLFAASASVILGYCDQIWPPCLIRTRTVTYVSDNPCGVFASPGPTSSSNGENYIILLFSERPIPTDCEWTYCRGTCSIGDCVSRKYWIYLSWNPCHQKWILAVQSVQVAPWPPLYSSCSPWGASGKTHRLFSQPSNNSQSISFQNSICFWLSRTKRDCEA